MNNLALKCFLILRDLFFDELGSPKLFPLREKRHTQDDPFDEFIAHALTAHLPEYGAICQEASGSLISPDMVVYRNGVDFGSESVENNPDEIFGIEVKKLERKNGRIARRTGLDYNSTPPCGRIRVYTPQESELIIKGFYLFACLEQDPSSLYYVSAMTLCDGSILNDDFDLYSEITGPREKEINLGTYGDGANRNRPMLIFSNPLGADILDGQATLISELDLSDQSDNIRLAWWFIRRDTYDRSRRFFAYIDRRDIEDDHIVTEIEEPFPIPQNRVTETQSRGKFMLETDRS